MFIKLIAEYKNTLLPVNKLTYLSIDLSQLYSHHIKFHNDKTYALRYSYYI
jgi:hypothetical protein